MSRVSATVCAEERVHGITELFRPRIGNRVGRIIAGVVQIIVEQLDIENRQVCRQNDCNRRKRCADVVMMPLIGKKIALFFSIRTKIKIMIIPEVLHTPYSSLITVAPA